MPAAIFVLVVVASIVAAMVRLGIGQTQETSLSLLGARAWWAASSGLEWGIHRVSTSNTCFTDTTLNIDSFSVQVNCIADPYQEAGANSVVRYQVSAEAVTRNQSIDDPDYVFRATQVELLIKISN